MKVGDITKMDANIHAGVKCVRFMIDTFYANEPMESWTRASSRSRLTMRTRPDQAAAERARKRGSTSKWFNNVELVAKPSAGNGTIRLQHL